MSAQTAPQGRNGVPVAPEPPAAIPGRHGHQGPQEAREWMSRACGQLPEGHMPRRDLGDAARAPELRVLMAWIEATMASSVWATMAQFESAWMAIQADVARREHDLGTIADLYLPADIDPALRQLFALPSGQAQDVLLGHREENGIYVPGWAEFSESEYRAITLWLEPVEERDENGYIVTRLREPWEIARDMTPERAKRTFGRRAWLKEETIERYLRGARAKLRLLFGMANPHTGVLMGEWVDASEWPHCEAERPAAAGSHRRPQADSPSWVPG